MGFGTEILFIGILGVLLLGPKRLPAILGHIARAKARLESATHNLKAELEAELETQRHDGHADNINKRSITGQASHRAG